MKTEDINYPIPKQGYTVLVRCYTYNHSKYIEDALNGFAMQQTDFSFVCLVMDDASTDGEQEVIKNWMQRECDMSKAETIDIPTSTVIIVPHIDNKSCTFAFYLLKQNLNKVRGGKKKHVDPWRDRCKYEALCEGDDYWIDPKKLQTQVDFMESNPDCYLCTHGTNMVDENDCRVICSKVISKQISLYSMSDAIAGYGRKTCTPSFLFRSILITKLPIYVPSAPCCDYVLPVLAAHYGNVANLPSISAAHRVLSSNSMTSVWKQDFSKRVQYNNRFEQMLNEIDIFTNHKYSDIIERERIGLWFRSYLVNGDISELKKKKYKLYIKTLSVKERISISLQLYFPFTYKMFKLFIKQIKR